MTRGGVNRRLLAALLLAAFGCAVVYLPTYVSAPEKPLLYAGTLVYVGGVAVVLWDARGGDA